MLERFAIRKSNNLIPYSNNLRKKYVIAKCQKRFQYNQ